MHLLLGQAAMVAGLIGAAPFFIQSGPIDLTALLVLFFRASLALAVLSMDPHYQPVVPWMGAFVALSGLGMLLIFSGKARVGAILLAAAKTECNT